MDEIFKGLKVIELATVLAGPAVGMFFAELGAEVTKIENPLKGDMTRKWGDATEDRSGNVSSYFSSINYKKHYLKRNFKDQKDREEVLHLISQSDVVITNLKEESASDYGLHPMQLKEKFPQLIIGQIRGFEQKEGVAFDVVMQAETGFLSMTGSQEGELCKMPVALIDVIAAHQLKEGILIALLRKHKTKQGGLVSVSLESAAFSSLMNQASSHLMNGTIPKPLGTLHPHIAPYGDIVETSFGDRYVLAIGTDKQFEDLCKILSSSELTMDERFSGNRKRIQNRTELLTLLNSASKKVSSEYFEEKCRKAKVPIGKIRDLGEALSSESAQNMIRKEVIDGIKTSRLTSVAFTLD